MTGASTNQLDSYLRTNVFDLMSLRDRVVVITGAAKGIGLALAFAVAEAGGKVAAIDAAAEPHGSYAQLQELCPETRYYQSDVTDYDKLQGTFKEIAKDFHRIDGLITAAGICPDQPFLDRDPASVQKCVEVNNLGTYYSAQLAARQMVCQPRRNETAGAGSIVLIASVAAHRASKDQYTSDYCMSKGGVLSLCRQLGVELADQHIRVNCISPGYIATDLTVDLVKMRPKLGEVFNSEPAMKRMGDRSDLKAASVYLLSDASAYMTSGEMLITGGLHAGRVH
ncbi:NAD(P)-binding protein [Pleurostoma richardsiae]|uniref:NAD(P)-binding protein n=1 Tax=Pleurostoma richardsiae TaxID=41990 RepID=A0AA38RB52_9PEZI|nr:NAD(P)-binding protein [Pleurostoma richardsiae]